MTTVVSFADAWGLWTTWTVIDVLMAIFREDIPAWLAYDPSKWFMADFVCAVFIGWLWLTCRRRVALSRPAGIGACKP